MDLLLLQICVCISPAASAGPPLELCVSATALLIDTGEGGRLGLGLSAAGHGYRPLGAVVDVDPSGWAWVPAAASDGAEDGREPGVVLRATHVLDTHFFSGAELARLAASGAVGGAAPPDPIVGVRCTTTKGAFRILVHPSWAPVGARRFLDMVRARYFDGSSFFRVLAGFLVQFGLAADPVEWRRWDGKGLLRDDPKRATAAARSLTPRFALPPAIFPRGGISFAGWGPNSRATNVFIAYQSGSLGRSRWEVPFGVVPEKDMVRVVDKLYSGYGEIDMQKIQERGNAFLQETPGRFGKLDYFRSCVVEQGVEGEHGAPAGIEDANMAADSNLGIVGLDALDGTLNDFRDSTMLPLQKGDELSAVAEAMRSGVQVATHRRGWQRHKECFLGSDAVEWMIAGAEGGVTGEVGAVKLGQMMVREGLLHHVDRSRPFANSRELYRFRADEPAPTAASEAISGAEAQGAAAPGAAAQPAADT
eukprot:g5409.t1